MSISLAPDNIVIGGQITVEEAEKLLEWLAEYPSAHVDLRALEHLHAANLQVLMAAKPHIVAWPQDIDTQLWLQAALKSEEI